MLSRTSTLEAVPPPEVVRQRLTDALREASILRALLRISERAAKELQRQRTQVVGGPQHAA
jgi:hypothetical protein